MYALSVIYLHFTLNGTFNSFVVKSDVSYLLHIIRTDSCEIICIFVSSLLYVLCLWWLNPGTGVNGTHIHTLSHKVSLKLLCSHFLFVTLARLHLAHWAGYVSDTTHWTFIAWRRLVRRQTDGDSAQTY